MSIRRLTLALASLLAVACSGSDDPAPADDTLTITGALASAPTLRALMDSVPILGVGTPASISIGMYGLHLSESPACTAAIAAEPEGAIRWYDFAASPTLFSAAPPDGSYHCVALRMSDVMRFVPDGSYGRCVAGTEYTGDIYRSDSDETPWHDLDHQPIVGRGSDDSPVDDHVIIVATTDTAAAIAAGFSRHQIIPLVTPLVVPGEATLVVDARNRVISWGYQDARPCDLEGVALDFQ